MHRSPDEVRAELFGSNIHSFIVKIWLEEPAEGSGQAVWRGRITHVPSEKSQSLMHLHEIIAFILPYLERMGVRFRAQERVMQWLDRWEHALTSRG